jgi:hypothetical protein
MPKREGQRLLFFFFFVGGGGVGGWGGWGWGGGTAVPRPLLDIIIFLKHENNLEKNLQAIVVVV